MIRALSQDLASVAMRPGPSPVQFIGLKIMLLLSTIDVLSKNDTGERRSPLRSVSNVCNTILSFFESRIIIQIATSSYSNSHRNDQHTSAIKITLFVIAMKVQRT